VELKLERLVPDPFVGSPLHAIVDCTGGVLREVVTQSVGKQRVEEDRGAHLRWHPEAVVTALCMREVVLWGSRCVVSSVRTRVGLG
jgi:hypothetical protein